MNVPIQHSSLPGFFLRGDTSIQSEQLILKPMVSLTGYYLPEGQHIVWKAAPDVLRTHLMLFGRSMLETDRAQIRLDEGYAISVGPTQKHWILGEKGGCVLFTLALSGSSPGQNSEITQSFRVEILPQIVPTDSLPARATLQHVTLNSRTSVSALGSLKNSGVRLHPRSESILFVIRGQASLRVNRLPVDLFAPSVYVIPPDTPYHITGISGFPCVLLVCTPEGIPQDQINNFSCGARVNRCDLASIVGDSIVQVNRAGTLISWNEKAAVTLGIPHQSLEPNISQFFSEPELLHNLLLNAHSGPQKPTALSLLADSRQSLRIFCIPFSGEGDAQTLIMHLRQEEPLPTTMSSATTQNPPTADYAEIIRWFQHLGIHSVVEELCHDRRWFVIWGDVGSGKSTVARYLHSISNPQPVSAHYVDCASVDHFALSRNLFMAPDSNGGSIEPGKWLLESNEITIILDNLDVFPPAISNDIMRKLSQLKLSGRVAKRVVVTQKHRPQKALPTSNIGNLLPRRGGFEILHLPTVRENPNFVPELIQHALVTHPTPDYATLSVNGDAISRLMSYAWPNNFHTFVQLVTAIRSLPTGCIVDRMLVDQLIEGIDGPVVSAAIDSNLTLSELEKNAVLLAMRNSQNRKSEAAKRLGITRSKLYRMLQEYGLEQRPWDV